MSVMLPTEARTPLQVPSPSNNSDPSGYQSYNGARFYISARTNGLEVPSPSSTWTSTLQDPAIQNPVDASPAPFSFDLTGDGSMLDSLPLQYSELHGSRAFDSPRPFPSPPTDHMRLIKVLASSDGGDKWTTVDLGDARSAQMIKERMFTKLDIPSTYQSVHSIYLHQGDSSTGLPLSDELIVNICQMHGDSAATLRFSIQGPSFQHSIQSLCTSTTPFQSTDHVQPRQTRPEVAVDTWLGSPDEFGILTDRISHLPNLTVPMPSVPFGQNQNQANAPIMPGPPTVPPPLPPTILSSLSSLPLLTVTTPSKATLTFGETEGDGLPGDKKLSLALPTDTGWSPSTIGSNILLVPTHSPYIRPPSPNLPPPLLEMDQIDDIRPPKNSYGNDKAKGTAIGLIGRCGSLEEPATMSTIARPNHVLTPNCLSRLRHQPGAMLSSIDTCFPNSHHQSRPVGATDSTTANLPVSKKCSIKQGTAYSRVPSLVSLPNPAYHVSTSHREDKESSLQENASVLTSHPRHFHTDLHVDSVPWEAIFHSSFEGGARELPHISLSSTVCPYPTHINAATLHHPAPAAPILDRIIDGDYGPMDRPSMTKIGTRDVADLLQGASSSNAIPSASFSTVLHENPTWDRQLQEMVLSDSLADTAPCEYSTGLPGCANSNQSCGFGRPGFSSDAGGNSSREHSYAAPTNHMSRMPNVALPSNNQEFLPISYDPTHSNAAKVLQETANSKINLGAGAFLPHSRFPNNALAHFLDLIKASAFIWFNELEPCINSQAGQDLLRAVSNYHECPLIPDRDSDHSIYILMVDRLTNKCLMCGQTKGSPQRAITCIRGHLDHRPFVCGGYSAGCLTCGEKPVPARFCSSSLLTDHINGQIKKTECSYPNCNRSVRRGGMRRHWDSMHKDTPFPSHKCPKYKSPQSRPPRV